MILRIICSRNFEEIGREYIESDKEPNYKLLAEEYLPDFINRSSNIEAFLASNSWGNISFSNPKRGNFCNTCTLKTSNRGRIYWINAGEDTNDVTKVGGIPTGSNYWGCNDLILESRPLIMRYDKVNQWWSVRETQV